MVQKKYDITSHIINSYEELVTLVRKKRKKDAINIENVEFSFELNLRRLLTDIGLFKEPKDEHIHTLTRSLIINNVKCKSLQVSNLHINDIGTDIQIRNCYIDKLGIHSCHISSLNFINASVKELNIIDSHIKGETNLWLDLEPVTDNVKIDIEDTYFGKNLRLSHIKINGKSELNIFGGKTTISGDCVFSDITMLGGNIDVRCNIKHDLRFNCINYQGEDDEYKKPLNFGKIELHETTVGNELIFHFCHIEELGITNSAINGIRENVFSYDRLQYGAVVALRDGAMRKNDIVLSEKYTAELYDARIKENAVKAYRRWANLLDGKSFKRKNSCKNFFNKYFLEPIILLIPSLTSSEGILLWLNKYSNNYTRSWLRGIFFTLTITLLSFISLNYFGMKQSFFVFDLHFNGFKEVIKGYLSLLDVFNISGIADKVDFDLTACGYTILFVSKVLITYGFWQTIYAFYRYRK